MENRIFTASDIVNMHSFKHSSIKEVLKSMRNMRKFGFRLCKVDFTGSLEEQRYRAALFLLSIYHKEVFIDKIEIKSDSTKNMFREAIEKSGILLADINELLEISSSEKPNVLN